MAEKISIPRSFHETILHYQELRRITHKLTEEEYADFAIQLREITHTDAVEGDTWATQWHEKSKAPDWAWKSMHQNYHSNTGLKRFDAALIKNGVLCALCYGIPTRAKLTLKIHAIGRKPDHNPLEGHIITMMLFAADIYARLLGCHEIWLANPRNEKLVKVYELAGYTTKRNRFGKPTHLALRLNYEHG